MYGHQGLRAVPDDHNIAVLLLPVEFCELQLLLVVIHGADKHHDDYRGHDGNTLDPVDLLDGVSLGVELRGLVQQLVEPQEERDDRGRGQEDHSLVRERLADELEE